jgi:stress-induced morphogen
MDLTFLVEASSFQVAARRGLEAIARERTVNSTYRTDLTVVIHLVALNCTLEQLDRYNKR